MEWTVTLGLMAFFVAFGVLCGWLGARPPNVARGPRMVPWRFMMMLAAFGFIVTAAHVLNLLGIQTGRGRGPY
jgi:hypothetical protein